MRSDPAVRFGAVYSAPACDVPCRVQVGVKGDIAGCVPPVLGDLGRGFGVTCEEFVQDGDIALWNRELAPDGPERLHDWNVQRAISFVKEERRASSVA